MSPGPSAVPGRFDGALVAISGAGSGIGRASALRFAGEGARVLAGDIDETGLAALTETAAGHGLSVEPVLLDQSDEASVAAFIAGAGVAGLDVLCVNAGTAMPDRPLVDLTAAEWDRLHAVNLRGSFLVARAAIPALERRGGGSIVFTASTSGLRAHPMAVAYAATKAGLLGLSRSLALELAPAGIRVNCVCPGSVATPLVERVYGADTPEILALAASLNPLGRVAEPEDVAAAISFLSSGDARHITAFELIVDGGQAAKLA